mmetsp:Transcript_57004/g.144708  ORF Transcript_57004/g.144708 Transcript_57004/m.144708 type:complete len:98 (+) Transcript_57004:1195-1488(+)
MEGKDSGSQRRRCHRHSCTRERCYHIPVVSFLPMSQGRALLVRRIAPQPRHLQTLKACPGIRSDRISQSRHCRCRRSRQQFQEGQAALPLNSHQALI